MIDENWIEKYRPRTLTCIIGHDDIIKTLQAGLNNRRLSNLIFHGTTPGTGKTTTARALAHDLFGEKWEGAFYEANAADYRGIDAIREKILPRIKHMPLISGSFRFIFLDQADSITPEAQDLLCVPMEKTPNVRFILSCNRLSRIAKPIISRCKTYEFKPINKSDVVKRLRFIAEREELAIDAQQLEAIAERCKGDLREAINDLQAMNPPPIGERQILNIRV